MLKVKKIEVIFNSMTKKLKIEKISLFNNLLIWFSSYVSGWVGVGWINSIAVRLINLPIPSVNRTSVQ